MSGLFGLPLKVFSLNEVIPICLLCTGVFSTSAWCLGVVHVTTHGCYLPTYSWIINRLNGTIMQIYGAFSYIFFFLLLLYAINPSHLTPWVLTSALSYQSDCTVGWDAPFFLPCSWKVPPGTEWIKCLFFSLSRIKL